MGKSAIIRNIRQFWLMLKHLNQLRKSNVIIKIIEKMSYSKLYLVGLFATFDKNGDVLAVKANKTLNK